MKDAGIERAETNFHKHSLALEEELAKGGLLSPTELSVKKLFDEATASLQKAKDEALPEFDPDWYPTLWRSYMAFGPSEQQPHGHGGFHSPHTGAYLSNGPLPPAIGLLSPPQNGSRAEARKKGSKTVSDEKNVPCQKQHWIIYNIQHNPISCILGWGETHVSVH